MNDNGSLTASDVALLTGNNNDGFGNGGWGGMIWLFAILALMGGGFGGNWGGGGYRPQYATQDFVQAGMNFSDLQDQNRDLMTAITNGTAQAVAATNQAKYDNINVEKDIQAALTAQIGDVRTNQMTLMANQNDCCCSTKISIS